MKQLLKKSSTALLILLLVIAGAAVYFVYSFGSIQAKFINHSDEAIAGDIHCGSTLIESIAIAPNNTLKWRWKPSPEHMEKDVRLVSPDGTKLVTIDGYILSPGSKTTIVITLGADGVLQFERQ